MSIIFIYTIFYTLSILGILAVALLVILRYRTKMYVYFSVFSLLLSVWLGAQFISQILHDNKDLSLLLLRFSTFVACYIAIVFLNFIRIFTNRREIRTLLVIPPVFISFMLLTSLGITQADISDSGIAIKDAGLAYLPYLILVGSYLIYGVILLVIDTAKTKEEVARKRNLTLIAGLGQAVLLIVGGSVFLAENKAAQLVVPTSFLILVFSISYAIVKHRLFDIRLVIARSAAYVLSFGALGMTYGILSFYLIGNFLFNENTSQIMRSTIYALIAVLLAYTFPPIQKFFDRWSNKIFYRDAYDAQELIDKLNTILVSTIDLKKLTNDIEILLRDTLKLDFVSFLLISTSGSSLRSFSNNIDLQGLVGDDNFYLKNSKVTITDEIQQSEVKLQNKLRNFDVGLIIQLKDRQSANKKIGFIVLGNKKSGSPYSRQDIKVLEIIADELVIAIQNALRFEEIQSFNITLQEKVDDATKKLRDANKRLIELDQTKDDFISMASHQLRTPLTSIKGYVSMVMEGDAGKITKKQNDLLNQSFISAQRMVYLIADLLNVSRLRTGKFVIEPKKTNLADVIDGEMAQLTETAKGRNLELKYNKPADFPELMLDENKIRQVIMNFIDNAIYYTPASGHIAVNLEDKGDAIEFTVVDDGIGVPKTVQHYLFNKFYRADNAKKARPDGTGLGLFMAKKVVVAQGGSIIFKSQEGKGSTFGFSFTKKPLLPESFKGHVEPEKTTN